MMEGYIEREGMTVAWRCNEVFVTGYFLGIFVCKKIWRMGFYRAFWSEFCVGGLMREKRVVRESE